MCICSTASLPGIYKPPELSKKIHSSTSLHLDHSSPRPLQLPEISPSHRLLPWTTHMSGSFSWRSWRGTKNFSTAPGLPMPSRPQLFLHRLAIQVHTQGRTIQVHNRERAIQVHTQECAIQVHTQNMLSKCTLRMCYPSAHSERAIQVHTQNVLSKCTLRTCYPSAHSERAIQVHGIRVRHSRTLMHH